MRTLAALLLLVGCAAGEGGDPTGDLTAVEETWPAGLAIGTGDLSFEPLVEGDPLLLSIGPASPGYRVMVGGVVRGMSNEVSVRPMLSLVDGTVLASPSTTYLALSGFDETECVGEFWGIRAELDGGRGPDMIALVCSLEGVPVELAVEVTSLWTGAVVSGSLDLVVALDETAQADCP